MKKKKTQNYDNKIQSLHLKMFKNGCKEFVKKIIKMII